MFQPEQNVVYTEENKKGMLQWDLTTRLLKDRIIYISDVIDDDQAKNVISQLLLLDKDSSKDIVLYINSPGGYIPSGLAIIDTMNYVRGDVATVVIGTAASMAAVIAASGTKGKRQILPLSEIMIHQPRGGVYGSSDDIRIAHEHIQRSRKTLYQLLSSATGKTVKRIEKDCDRDYYMTAKEALEYGLVDKIVSRRDV